MNTCNRIESGACQGCNVISILWEKTKTQEEVDKMAERISQQNCPDISGGIDNPSRNTVYNYRLNIQKPKEIPVW